MFHAVKLDSSMRPRLDRLGVNFGNNSSSDGRATISGRLAAFDYTQTVVIYLFIIILLVIKK